MLINTDSRLECHLNAIPSRRVLLSIHIVYIKSNIVLLQRVISSKWVQLLKLGLFVVVNPQDWVAVSSFVIRVSHAFYRHHACSTCSSRVGCLLAERCQLDSCHLINPFVTYVRRFHYIVFIVHLHYPILLLSYLLFICKIGA